MIFKEKWQKIIIVGFFLVVYGSKKTPWSLIMPFFVEKECISNAPQGLLVLGRSWYHMIASFVILNK